MPVTSLLTRVRSRMSIPSHRPVRAVLDGEYSSVFHGRSVDFDDLRPYVAGDEPKDIDWKATARHGALLTKRSIAARKHTIMLVADSGRAMAALAPDGTPKVDIGILLAGMTGHLATRHGDRVGLVVGDAERSQYRAPAGGEAHLERLLQLMLAQTTLDSAPSDLSTQLRYLVRSFRRRMILVVISDDRMLGDEELALLRRLTAQHEVLWLTVADADPTRAEWAGSPVYDVAQGAGLPSFVRDTAAVRREFAEATATRAAVAESQFEALGISRRRVERAADALPQLLRLLEVHRHARR